MAQAKEWSLVDASISDLKQMLDTRAITSVELVSLYLHRIAQYDCQGPRLNSICVINPKIFEEAQMSDDYRSSGKPPRPLEGIPFTVKDSYMVKGLTVAAGSPAFADLVASSDAAVVESLREAGAIVLGKTNMPPMADGGCQRGLYGRSESPYNQEYMSTAYASGSSYGCGVSTAASLAAFGFAGESVSSGRSPASNNALVAYTSSRSVIPCRGLWPLYPTCDLVVPHTRSMSDLLHVLNVIVKDDVSGPDAGFWRSQQFVPIPKASEMRPTDYLTLADAAALRGKRVAVPRCFIGAPGAKPDHACSTGVRALWDQARVDLESLGATVIESDFPVLEMYTKQDFPGQSSNVPGLSQDWTFIERCELIALGWADFLKSNGDSRYPSLTAADPSKIHPHVAPMDDPSQHTESQNQVRYEDMFEAVRTRQGELTDLPGCDQALQALEAMREKYFEQWMDENNYDLVVFPTNGDVAKADADENRQSMLEALRDGVKYANGGRCLKHLGIPCITVPMGTLEEEKMPVGLSFCGKAYKDSDLLRYAYAYESVSKGRIRPPLAPELISDKILSRGPESDLLDLSKPVLDVVSIESVKEDSADEECRVVKATGTVTSGDVEKSPATLSVFANGQPSSEVSWEGNKWTWTAQITRPLVEDRYPVLAAIPRDHFMVVFVTQTKNGRSAGSLHLLP